MTPAYQVYFIRILYSFLKKKLRSLSPYLCGKSKCGKIIFKFPITSIVKPIVSGKNLFLITKDNLLVCINLENGKIIYSIDISSEIANFLDAKKKTISVKSLSLAENNLLIFLNNSYLVVFNNLGKIKKIEKLKSDLKSFPIFINSSVLFFNKNNRLIVLINYLIFHNKDN